jgi:hypothetical protein
MGRFRISFWVLFEGLKTAPDKGFWSFPQLNACV